MSVEDEIRRSLVRRVASVEASRELFDRLMSSPTPTRPPAARRLGIVAFALVVGFGSFVFLASTLRHHESEPATTPGPWSVQEIPLSPGIGRMIGGFGSIWVLEPDGVARVDPSTGEVVHIRVNGVTPPGVKLPLFEFGGRLDGSGLTPGDGFVWVTAEPNLLGIDPSTNEVVRRIPEESGVTNISFADGRLIVGGSAEGNGDIRRLDSDTGNYVGTIPSGTRAYPMVLPTEDWYWAAGAPYDRGNPTLTRSSKDGSTEEAIAGVSEVDSFVEAGGYLWVAGSDTLYQLDETYAPRPSPQFFPEREDAVVRTFPISGPGRVASDGTHLWLLEPARTNTTQLTELDPTKVRPSANRSSLRTAVPPRWQCSEATPGSRSETTGCSSGPAEPIRGDSDEFLTSLSFFPEGHGNEPATLTQPPRVYWIAGCTRLQRNRRSPAGCTLTA
jgi:hypothetical protein